MSETLKDNELKKVNGGDGNGTFKYVFTDIDWVYDNEEKTMIKTAYKTAVKNFMSEVESGNKDKATELFKIATKAVDQAANKGVIKSNTASRKKSSLAKALNTVK